MKRVQENFKGSSFEFSNALRSFICSKVSFKFSDVLV